MHYKVAVLLSTATFSLCTFARPSPPPPSAQSDVNPTPLHKRYVNGSCGVHVTQYQKNEGPQGSDGGNSEYRLDVGLFDAKQDPVGGVSKLSVPGGSFIDIDSQLPDVFKVLVGGTDGQSIDFKYAGQAWTSDQCSVGGYNGGSRNMDCKFNC